MDEVGQLGVAYSGSSRAFDMVFYSILVPRLVCYSLDLGCVRWVSCQVQMMLGNGSYSA